MRPDSTPSEKWLDPEISGRPDARSHSWKISSRPPEASNWIPLKATVRRAGKLQGLNCMGGALDFLVSASIDWMLNQCNTCRWFLLC